MAAAYQHASDYIPGMGPFSGVIRSSDGKWIACQAVADSQDWADYLTWAETPGNVPDPYLHPDQGGVTIVLQPEEVPVGTMCDSLPEAEGGNPVIGLPPKNVDVPVVMPTTANVGDELTCTMGNWEGEPKLYSSVWVSDAVDVLTYGGSYVVQPSDAGHSLTCIVEATNDFGAAKAPPSNAVAIPAAGGAVGTQSRSREPAHAEPEHEEHRSRRHKEE